jgi:hypothetical protein
MLLAVVDSMRRCSEGDHHVEIEGRATADVISINVLSRDRSDNIPDDMPSASSRFGSAASHDSIRV